MELWKEIKGFEGVYSVSNYGRIKSFKKSKEGFILSNVNKNGGYLSIVLSKGENIKYTRCHRLVAEYFLQKIEGKTQVNHKDFDKQNNHYLNLEWVTPKENIKHLIDSGKDFTSEMIYNNRFIRPKKIIQKSLNGDFIALYQNAKEANFYSGVCQRNILQVASKTEYKTGKTRSQAGGFIWEFKI